MPTKTRAADVALPTHAILRTVPRRRARSSPRASCTAVVDGTNGRNLPSPLASPPFPGSEWDGAPIIGVSGEVPGYPLYEALGLAKRKSRFKVYGWASIGGNLSTSHDPAAVLVSTRGGTQHRGLLAGI